MSPSRSRRTTAAALIGLGATALALMGPGDAARAAQDARPAPRPVEVQLLALNDFHGQLEPPAGSGGRIQVGPSVGTTPGPTVDAGGAEHLATQLAELTAQEEHDHRGRG